MLSVGLGTAAALAPKCPGCVLGYLSLAGLGAGTAEVMVGARPWVVGLLCLSLVASASFLLNGLAPRR